MIDKLASIHKRNNKNNTAFTTAPYSADTLTLHTDSPHITASHTGDSISEEFSHKVTNARNLILRIKHNNTAIQTIKLKYQQVIKSQQQKQCSQQIEKIVNDNSNIHKSVKKLLDQMNAEIEMCMQNPRLKHQPETKMKKNMFMAVSSELAQTLQEERAQQDGFKGTVKKKVTRQVKLIDPTLSQVQLEHYANNPKEASQLLQKRVGMASVHLRNAVQDISEKCRDIQRLERSVNECLYLFKELSEMVYAQGQQIDNIQMHVRDAQDYVERADVQIVKAKKRDQCKKKCCCWTTIIVVILVVIIVAVVIPIAIRAAKGGL